MKANARSGSRHSKRLIVIPSAALSAAIAAILAATPPSAYSEDFIFIRTGSGGKWTQANYNIGGSPGKDDNLIMAGDGSTIATLNASGDRQVNNLSSIIAGASITGGSDVSTLIIHGNLTIDTAGASLLLRNGSSPNLLDVTVKKNVDILQGTLNLGTTSLPLKSFVVEGTTTVSSVLNSFYANSTGISLGDLVVNSGGTANLMYGAGTLTGSATSTVGARSLSGSGTVKGSDMSGEGTRHATLEVVTTGATNASFGGVLENGAAGSTLHLSVNGAGRQKLTGVNTYTGVTKVSGAMLVLGSSGSINSSSGITIENGGTLIQNSSTNLTTTITFANGTIGGTGTIVGNLAIGTNNTLSPGNSPGSQTFAGNQTWNASGNYNWQVYDAAGAAGIAYDLLNITGTLDLSGLTSSNTFNLNLWSLSGIAPDANGDAIHFDGNQSYSWLIVSAGAIAYNELYAINDLFSLNLEAFNGTAGFQNANAGEWSVSIGSDGKELYLNYTAIPEPDSLLSLTGGLALLLSLRRRNFTGGGSKGEAATI